MIQRIHAIPDGTIPAEVLDEKEPRMNHPNASIRPFLDYEIRETEPYDEATGPMVPMRIESPVYRHFRAVQDVTLICPACSCRVRRSELRLVDPFNDDDGRMRHTDCGHASDPKDWRVWEAGLEPGSLVLRRAEP